MTDPTASPLLSPAQPTPAPSAAVPKLGDFKPWIDTGSPGRIDPATADPEKFVQTRDGLKDRKTGALVSGGADPAQPQPSGDAPAPDAEKVKIGDHELSADDVKMLLQQKAENDLRATKVPKDASGYKLDLPKDLPLPDGFSFAWDQSSPILKDAAAFAHRNGFDQDQFGQMLGLYAVHQAKEAATFQTAQAAQLAALGPMATTRVTAVQTFLRGHLGDTLATAMAPMLVTAKIIEGFEKLANLKASQGTAMFSQQHRVHDDPRRVDPAVYDKMSYTQKLDYARNFPQSGAR